MNDIEVNAILQAIAKQRNEALDACAVLSGKLAVAESRIRELEANIAEKPT